ncbi:MAG: hypothetical protein KC588_08035, partial [Nitrospira sp.]|nr:hypothetical protein [Nitrospira sp.]
PRGKENGQGKRNLSVPLHLRNAVMSLMKELDHGNGYCYAHDDPTGAKNQTHLPKGLEGRRYYGPKSEANADDEEDITSPC